MNVFEQHPKTNQRNVSNIFSEFIFESKITPPRKAHQQSVCGDGGNAAHISTVPDPPGGRCIPDDQCDERITEKFISFFCCISHKQ